MSCIPSNFQTKKFILVQGPDGCEANASPKIQKNVRNYNLKSRRKSKSFDSQNIKSAYYNISIFLHLLSIICESSLL